MYITTNLKNIRIGTRASKLALIQTELVVNEIKKYYPNIICEIIPIKTTGDKILNRNLYDIGGKSLFVKEIEQALIDGNIDIAVHSLKDLPSKLPDNLEIGAVLKRDDPREVLITTNKSIKNLQDLKQENFIFGTSSPRRSVLVQSLNANTQIITLRGNIGTRINVVKDAKKMDFTILSLAGLKRAKLYNEEYCTIIPLDEFIPPAGQGVIAIETVKNNESIQELCKLINHQETWVTSVAERSFLQYLNANCDAPIGAYATIQDSQINAKYMMAEFNKPNSIKYYSIKTDLDNAELIGHIAAKHMIDHLL